MIVACKAYKIDLIVTSQLVDLPQKLLTAWSIFET